MKKMTRPPPPSKRGFTILLKIDPNVNRKFTFIKYSKFVSRSRRRSKTSSSDAPRRGRNTWSRTRAMFPKKLTDSPRMIRTFAFAKTVRRFFSVALWPKRSCLRERRLAAPERVDFLTEFLR